MSKIEFSEFQSPEKLHMRPCGVIARFVQDIEWDNGGIKISLSHSGKKARATSILLLTLLWIEKNDVFFLEIEWGSPDQTTWIVQSFRKLIHTQLWNPELHNANRKLITPLWIQLRGWSEKHPEHDKFQERHDFLIRIKEFLEENKDYFYKPESLAYDEYERIRKLSIALREEAKYMVDRHTMVLYDGWDIIRYLFRDNPSRESRDGYYQKVLEYKIPASILEAQRHLGIIPINIVQPIYHNFHIVLTL